MHAGHGDSDSRYVPTRVSSLAGDTEIAAAPAPAAAAAAVSTHNLSGSVVACTAGGTHHSAAGAVTDGVDDWS